MPNGQTILVRSTNRAPVLSVNGTLVHTSHLYMSGEMLASVLLTHHNLAFFRHYARCEAIYPVWRFPKISA